MSLKKYLYAVAESHFLTPISEYVYFNPGVAFTFILFNYVLLDLIYPLVSLRSLLGAT